jgi:hypothetical protein
MEVPEISTHDKTLLTRSGIIAALGAFIVGIGEFTFQFSPRGGYEGSDYLYFLDVSPFRLTFGHFLAVLFAPIYLVGYWHVAAMLRPAGKWISAAVLIIGGYAFAIGNVWLGGRVNLALVVQARDGAGDDTQAVLSALLADASAHNEPLINIVRILVLLVSVLLAWGIMRGRSYYPRWVMLLSPVVLLAAIFATYAVAPAVGVYVLPAAMNVAHFVFFVVSAWVASRIPEHP